MRLHILQLVCIMLGAAVNAQAPAAAPAAPAAPADQGAADQGAADPGAADQAAAPASGASAAAPASSATSSGSSSGGAQGQLGVDLDDEKSVKKALEKIAKGVLDYDDATKPGGAVGMFVPPYYWWQAGSTWNSLIDYWYFTGDDQFNERIKTAIQAQTGENNDMMTSNQTTTEGNDDQGFFGITAMAAAERNFTNPGKDKPQWLALAQAVFYTMSQRWDTKHCNGGLRWQIFTWNSGYNYKNTVSNGCFLNLAARLARYTQDDKYKDWAEKIWNWVESVNYLEDKSDGSIFLHDGAYIEDGCKEPSSLRWTYNYGLYISAAAFMYNLTEESKWKDRVEKLWKGSNIFFPNGVMYEASCQPSAKCQNDQRCFKGIFSRFLGLVMEVMPGDVADDIMDKLRSSANACLDTCQPGDESGTATCDLTWGGQTGYKDRQYGLGEQTCALEVIQNTLVKKKEATGIVNHKSGSSKGDKNAGKDSSDTVKMDQNKIDIETKDRAGAGVLTAFVIGILLGTAFWMLR